MRILSLSAIVLAGWGLISFAASAPAIRVMLLDGESAGTYHAWKLTTPVLKQELEETGLFQVDVVTAPPSSGDLSQFRPDFSQYRAVVFNYDAPDWPPALKTSFERYMSAGGGLVVVHAADNAFAGWKAWNEMTGIGGWRNRTEKAGPFWFYREGKLVHDDLPGPAGSHGARLPFQVTTRVPEHPIMKGLPAVWMHEGDELYAALRGPGENMTVLATAHSQPSNHGTGKDEPILMALSYGKGAGLSYDAGARRPGAQLRRIHRHFSARDRVGRDWQGDAAGSRQFSRTRQSQLQARSRWRHQTDLG